MSSWGSALMAAAVLFAGGLAAGSDAGDGGIDLSTLDGLVDDVVESTEALPLENVSLRAEGSSSRLYLSGMIGPSFASVNSSGDLPFSSDETLFNAGGAVGVGIERPRGRLRLELEGMGRSSLDAPIRASADPDDYTLLTNNWSVMTNAWRELSLGDRFGVYGGGGIGAGGYILGERLGSEIDYASPAGNFAWQVGGGLVWEVSDRLTFDVGYRYFQIDTIRQSQAVQPNQFSANELMFTLRLYDPFRRWMR